MLNENEMRLLDMICKQLLVTKVEIRSSFPDGGGVEVNLSRLIDMGYIDKVESLGTCYVATQKGIRAFKGEF